MSEVVLVMLIEIVLSAVGARQVSSRSVGRTIPYFVKLLISTRMLPSFIRSFVYPTEYAYLI